MTLSRAEALTLAKEVLAGQARSYVSAAHALAQFLVSSWDEEAAHRALVGDMETPRAPRTIPLPFEDPSPPPPIESDELDSDGIPPTNESELDATARLILRDATPVVAERHLVLVGPHRNVDEPETGVRDMLPTTNVGGRAVPRRTIPPDDDDGGAA